MKLMNTLTVAFLFIVSISQVSATIIRVNNIPGSNADYDNLQTAHDNAMGGDTLHLEPSPTSYGNLTMTKELTIIGNGYFLEDNPGLQSNTGNSIVNTIFFNSGSENSKITGLRINIGTQIKTDSITIERNYYAINSASFCCNYGMGFDGDVTNINIIQNYISGGVYSSTSGVATFIYFYNNIMIYPFEFQGDDSDIYLINNVFNATGAGYTYKVTGAMVRNNIMRAGAFNGNNSVIQNNIGHSTQFPAGNGNQQSVNMNTVFNFNDPSPDGQYQLRINSPALGAGFYGGEDCGAFDVPAGFGYVPYKLSGIPSVPSIYEFDTTVNGNTLNVTISTRSNN